MRLLIPVHPTKVDLRDIPAVTASSFVLALLGAVTSTVTGHIAIYTLHLNTINGGTLLLASFKGMSHFYKTRIRMSVSFGLWNMLRGLTIAVRALGNLPVKGESGVRKTFEIFFGGRRPAVLEIGALWLFAEVKPDYILAVKLSLQVNEAEAASDLFLLSFSPPVTTLLMWYCLWGCKALPIQ